jgi:hypothetical protein
MHGLAGKTALVTARRHGIRLRPRAASAAGQTVTFASRQG